MARLFYWRQERLLHVFICSVRTFEIFIVALHFKIFEDLVNSVKPNFHRN